MTDHKFWPIVLTLALFPFAFAACSSGDDDDDAAADDSTADDDDSAVADDDDVAEDDDTADDTSDDDTTDDDTSDDDTADDDTTDDDDAVDDDDEVADDDIAGPPEEGTGCEGETLYALPETPSERGPWPVGAKTVQIAGYRAEVWYPAVWGSDAGATRARYDVREHLPPEDAAKITDADEPWRDCDCYREVPLDTDHGPYPVILFMHGLGAFREQSLTFTVHWASRGFVVVAADHPGVTLPDVLHDASGAFSADNAGDGRKILDALQDPGDEVAFLARHIDMQRIGITGHSMGGMATGKLGDYPRALVAIPMAAGGVDPVGPDLRSTLVMGAQQDSTVPYGEQVDGYEKTAPKKRLLGLRRMGHLAFSDICTLAADRGGILAVAAEAGIEVNTLFQKLGTDGCGEEFIKPERGWEIIMYATAAAFEEQLHCLPERGALLTGIKDNFVEVGEYREELE